jgi:hypothetical protein
MEKNALENKHKNESGYFENIYIFLKKIYAQL